MECIWTSYKDPSANMCSAIGIEQRVPSRVEVENFDMVVSIRLHADGGRRQGVVEVGLLMSVSYLGA
jgi:hypothetical protein